jgi:hypothetical protein
LRPSKKPLRPIRDDKVGSRRRLEKLELRSWAHGLDAQPEDYWKRILIEKIEAISQRQQAARDRGEYVPRAEVGEVKARVRALLEERAYNASSPENGRETMRVISRFAKAERAK